MTSRLLSAGIGVPVALLAMCALFLAEMFNVTGRARPILVRSSAVLACVVLLGLIAARFMKYS
jgi:hypothetical protein